MKTRKEKVFNILLGFLVAVAIVLNFSLCAAADLPNVVIILADDMGWRDVGYHQSEIMTPRMDDLASRGVRLERFYAHPTCSPTRAALMTGKTPVRLGVLQPISKNMEGGLPLTEKILPQYFQDSGYQTLMAGKWHLGHATRKQLPLARGFEHFYGHTRGGIGYWDHTHGGGLDWQRNGKTLREEGYSTHLIANEAVRLIKGRDTSRPLFLYVAFNAPHMPNEAPPETIARYAHIDNEHRRVHAAMVSELDTAIGRIVDTLESQGMLHKTLIWFMSDNGGINPSAFPEGLVRWVDRLTNWFDKPLPTTFLEFVRSNVQEGGSDNTPYKKGKQSVYEGGVRVPALVFWPGRLSPKQVNTRITVQDILPTLGAALNLKGVAENRMDGVNQWPLLEKNQPVSPADYLTHAMDGEAYYQGPWKLIVPKFGDPELYNIDADPVETNDLAAKKPDIMESLMAKVEAFPRGESIHDPLWKVILDPDTFGGKEDRKPWSETVR